ncbi:MAG: ribosome biogenesis GTPase Der [Acidobacteria bacterium]|nr:ribosome biogenesis GTPase Der [Acidobacteriota bacterium]
MAEGEVGRAMGRAPTIAIVGRPNVGKSTLFNRLLGRRQAIVNDRPGVTRDRITGSFQVGPERMIHLIDTGGLVPGDDPIGLNRQVLMAVEESDLLLFVVDGKDGLTGADERVWQEFRRSGRPAVLVVNKSDTKAAQANVHEFSRLGLASTVTVSAEHGRGIGELLAAIEDQVPAAPGETSSGAPRLAIVGRPNVGKSSLLNRMVGAERALVSERPGTTRDPIDTLIERDGKSYVLVDTAGIRRRSRVEDPSEELAVMMARRQIGDADLAILVIDAVTGVTTGDLAIAGAIWELGRAAVIVVNKWDLLDEDGRERLDDTWPRLAGLLAAPWRVNTSAKTGRGLDKLLPAVEEALESYAFELSTAAVNDLFESIVTRHRPPTHQGKSWKFYYATQVTTRPPTFMLFANRTIDRNNSYRRYLENALRERLDLPGVPIRLVIRRRT